MVGPFWPVLAFVTFPLMLLPVFFVSIVFLPVMHPAAVAAYLLTAFVALAALALTGCVYCRAVFRASGQRHAHVATAAA